MEAIRFDKNWNDKLNGKVFTTIQKAGGQGIRRWFIGETVNIELNSVKVGKAKLIEIEIMRFRSVSPSLLMVNTGLDMDGCIKRFNDIGIVDDTEVRILTFIKVKDMF